KHCRSRRQMILYRTCKQWMALMQLATSPIRLARSFRAVWSQRLEDRQLQSITCGLRHHGGLATFDDVVLRMAPQIAQPAVALSRWMKQGVVIHLARKTEALLPLFQFDLTELGLDGRVAPVLQELGGIFDNWELALWFVTPNECTAGKAPVDMLQSC